MSLLNLNRNLAVCAFAILGLFSHAASGADKPTAKGSDYYPIKPGTKWVYKADVNGQPVALTNQVTKIEKINDIDMARIETLTADNQVIANEHISVNEKGVFRTRINGNEPIPAVCVVQYPAKAGLKWDVDCKVGNEHIKGKYSTEAEDVTVPAGKFKTIKVFSDAEIVPSGQKILSTIWMAEGVGIVKQFTDLGQVKITLELEKFEAGK